MQCVACGRDSSYNRAVVDSVTETELGVLCPECEQDQFGQTLDEGDWSDECCVLCDRDGFYALPAWRAYVVEIDGRRVSRSEYSLEPSSPRLCDAHFDRLTETTRGEDHAAPTQPP